MSKFSGLIRSIKDKLFGKKQVTSDSAHIKVVTAEKKPGASDDAAKNNRLGREHAPQPVSKTKRGPYFIQIGFDFGTSFSKCVYRDVMTNKAWVHVPSKYNRHELPFLIPSSCLLQDGKLQHVQKQDVHYPSGGLYHLKNALVHIALGNLDDSLLNPYRKLCMQAVMDLGDFIESCAVYFLAGALGEVRKQIRQKKPDFGQHNEDYLAVNMAVPVADAEQPLVNNLYNKILCEAWRLADDLAGHPQIALREVEALRRNSCKENVQLADEACFIYPEVSANVQGFVRSRVSQPGIYLFSDTGAGTVDQSTFIFSRSKNQDLLTFLHGNVLPCGSSHVEFNAARINGRLDSQSLEHWRHKKENGCNEAELISAKQKVADQLFKGTRSTLAHSKRKLFIREQLDDMRVIFGGGGHCEYPYRNKALEPFRGDLFRRNIDPDVVGLPIPIDLDRQGVQPLWMNRLSVAYGLSFEKSELANFIYPIDVSTPEPEQIWNSNRTIIEAVSKDQC